MFVNPYFGWLVPGLVQGKVTSSSGATEEKQRLTSDAPKQSAAYGRGIKMLDNELFVGEPGATGSIFAVGEVHYYTRPDSESNFVRQAGFFATPEQIGQDFGIEIAYDGTTLAVGASNESDGGGVHVFLWNGSIWAHEVVIDGNTMVGSDRFGRGIDVQGVHMLIGSPSAENGGSDLGRVEYWENIAGTWTFRSDFSSAETTNTQQFGMGVTMTDDSTAFVSRFGDGAGANLNTVTSVEKWTRSGTTWTFDSEWTIANGSDESQFVKLDNDGTNLIAGYGGFDDGGLIDANVGLVYILTQNGSALETIVGDQDDSQFGQGVSIDGMEAAIGSYALDSTQLDAGEAAIWDLGI